MALMTFVPAFWSWRRQARPPADAGSPLRNPLELGTALGFGLLLASILLLGTALQHWFGDAGVLALAAASGVADLDAITLSLARLGQNQLGAATAALGIVLAAAVNSVVKAGMAVGIGGRALAYRAALPLVAAALAGLATATAAVGIVLAAAVNSFVKAGMAVGIGGRALAPRVALPLVVAALAGMLTVWLTTGAG
jgi:uncharacterized membrane protein (DUF4010 family)